MRSRTIDGQTLAFRKFIALKSIVYIFIANNEHLYTIFYPAVRSAPLAFWSKSGNYFKFNGEHFSARG